MLVVCATIPLAKAVELRSVVFRNGNALEFLVLEQIDIKSGQWLC
jgi:hypothetical protein